MIAANCILGAIVLLFGRRLFWAFVAIAGFLVGVEVAELALAAQPVWVQVLAGLALGGLGAIVAVIAERVGFALAGFFAVGYVGMVVAEAMQPGTNLLVWFVIGGVVGGIVAALIMDPAIIVLSSSVGAAAIVSALALSPGAGLAAFIGLMILGIAVQSRTMRKARRDAGGASGNVGHAM